MLDMLQCRRKQAARCCESGRIDAVQRIIPDIAIEVDAASRSGQAGGTARARARTCGRGRIISR